MIQMKKVFLIVLSLFMFASTMTFTKAQEVEEEEILTSILDQEQKVLSMDENGNISYIDINNQDLEEVNTTKYIDRFKNQRELSSESDSGIDEAATYYVVRFRNVGVVNYYEDTTGIEGYTHASYGCDAAFLGTDATGSKVKFKLSGVTGWVNSSYVDLVPYSSSLNLSYYMIKNGKFYHFISGDIYGSSILSTQRLSDAPEGLKAGVKYYSYDGHYFYTSYSKMIKDYRNNVSANAINATIPYYNYYQFLPIREVSHVSATVLNRRVVNNVGASSSSRLLNSGSAFKYAEKFGVNAVIAMSIAINESGWGTSYFARNNNNLFGIGAFDGSGSAQYFSSVSECINYFAKNLLSLGYCDPTSWYYCGPHIGDKQSGMNVKYSSDPYWGEKAAAQAYWIEDLSSSKVRRTLLVETQDTYTYLYKSANSSSKLYYRNGNYDGKFIRQFPFVVLDTIETNTGTWYKVLSDAILKKDRSGLASKAESNGVYSRNYCYGYIKATPSQRIDDQVSLIDAFEDINKESWYYEVVSNMIDCGFMNGVDDLHFKPDSKMSRAMVVTAIYNMEGRPDVTYTKKFPDVKNGEWYSQAVIWANQKGIISGYSNGKFGPSNSITREDFCVILRNYAQYKKMDIKSQAKITYFKDHKKVSSYAKSAVCWAVAYSILTGSENQILPQSNTTRAQAAKMLWMVHLNAN